VRFIIAGASYSEHVNIGGVVGTRPTGLHVRLPAAGVLLDNHLHCSNSNELELPSMRDTKRVMSDAARELQSTSL